MKKRIMLGMTYWFWMFLFFIVGTIIFFIVFPLVSKKNIFVAETVTGIIVTIILSVICFLLDQGLNAWIQISEDCIIVNTIFNKKIYYKQDIVISYVIHEHKGRGAYECPCLVIGCWYDNRVCYTKRKFVYNNYFLVLLDDKKLKTILSWYNEKIDLPTKQEIECFYSKKIKSFYEIIERHNNINKD